jgi:hypothetical protein
MESKVDKEAKSQYVNGVIECKIDMDCEECVGQK